MIVQTTNSLLDGDKGNREHKAHVHSTLSPQLSFDLQTSTLLHHKLGLRSQRFRHFANAPLTLREQQLSRANKIARVTKMSGIQQGQPVNFALLYKNFGRSWGKKKNNAALEGCVWSPHKTCTSKRVRDMFVAALRTKYKNFPHTLG